MDRDTLLLVESGGSSGEEGRYWLLGTWVVSWG
jgi:hypothetical protein